MPTGRNVRVSRLEECDDLVERFTSIASLRISRKPSPVWPRGHAAIVLKRMDHPEEVSMAVRSEYEVEGPA
jgi:hypothetical protein